ncbi:MAG TPA: O-antigen ligase family protein [Candidatus Eisenbacteria bacterium]|nr:O-antigen ligase family protein [Candidatus Eisenbacteria bacterium]
MPVTATTYDRPEGAPLVVRLAIALGLPMVGAMTVAGTYFGKEILICAGWIALSVVGFLFVRPVVGIAMMTAAFLLAAYPTLLQSLGMLTINNLLGLCFVVLLAMHVLEKRDFSFLRNRQVQIFIVIGLLLLAGSMYADWIFPTLRKTVGRAKVLDKTEDMSHNFIARLVYLVFFIVFVRDRRDIRTMFLTFMLALFVAVPSALYNMATGTLNRGFRIAASFTSGANPNRLAMICLIEIACWWFWSRARPTLVRQALALGAMAASTMVLFGTGSRSGLLGVGVLAVLLQRSPRGFRITAPQIGLLAAAGLFAVLTMVPAESWERMINFLPQRGEVGATSNVMREETIERAWQIFWDYPLFGIGLGNFREVSRQIYQDTFFRPPHNSYLWAASEGGILVVIGYVVLFWVTWRDLQVITRLAHRDPEIGAAAGAIRVIFILYAFFSAFADLWLNPITYAMIGMIIVMRRYVESLPEPVPVRIVGRPGMGRLAA